MQLAPITREQADTIVTVLGAVATARGTQEPSVADRAVIRTVKLADDSLYVGDGINSIGSVPLKRFAQSKQVLIMLVLLITQ